MRHCSICRIGKQLHEFESVRGNCWRNECRECRRVQRKQRAIVTSADAHEDTASIMSGGAVTQASDADYDVSAPVHEERIRDSLRPIEEQLRVLTEEHRKGSKPSIGQRLVQLEHEMQSIRGANHEGGSPELDLVIESIHCCHPLLLLLAVNMYYYHHLSTPRSAQIGHGLSACLPNLFDHIILQYHYQHKPKFTKQWTNKWSAGECKPYDCCW